jgi:hypothetical protein
MSTLHRGHGGPGNVQYRGICIAISWETKLQLRKRCRRLNHDGIYRSIMDGQLGAHQKQIPCKCLDNGKRTFLADKAALKSPHTPYRIYKTNKVPSNGRIRISMSPRSAVAREPTCSVGSGRQLFGWGRAVIEWQLCVGPSSRSPDPATYLTSSRAPANIVAGPELLPRLPAVVSTTGAFIILPWMIHTRGEVDRKPRAPLTQGKTTSILPEASCPSPKQRPASLYRPAAVFDHRDRRHAWRHTVVPALMTAASR